MLEIKRAGSARPDVPQVRVAGNASRRVDAPRLVFLPQPQRVQPHIRGGSPLASSHLPICYPEMKRTAEAGPSTPSKRPRPDSQLVAQAFPPDQKRKAADICRKGSDGTGWIEGKVYQRGGPSAESWEFIMTAELGSRAQVLLSGSCSKHFAGLPIAVGAQVRVRTKGLTLEVVDDPPKLLLPKRFAWREGATLYVNNPKTGEESFVDTWAGAL